MRKIIVLIIGLLGCIGVADGQVTRKMSPLVKEAMMEAKTQWAGAKGSGAADVPCITAFVRCTNDNILKRYGCKIFDEQGDVFIAAIPLESLSALSTQSEVLEISAGKPAKLQNSAAKEYTNVELLRSATATAQMVNGYCGKGVVVGVIDVAFDYTHPTYRTADGKTLRIKKVWDLLDFSENGEEVSIAKGVGREYSGEAAILAKQGSADRAMKECNGHGTHTSTTAAGSGFNGTTTSVHGGMAPEADIVLVSTSSAENDSMIPKDKEYLYTDALQSLEMKYIFDYAEKEGKPCVINISMGTSEDLYQTKIRNDYINNLVGPGKIVCASAGNECSYGTYIYKPKEKNKAGAFINCAEKKIALYLLRSPEPPTVNVSLYSNSGEKVDWTYDAEKLRGFPDSLHVDSIVVDGRKIGFEVYSYPSCYDETRYATDVFFISMDGEKIGMPVSITLTDDMEEEAFAQTGYFVKNTKDASLCDFTSSHNIKMPAALDGVICVGSVNSSYESLKNKAGSVIMTNSKQGQRSPFSSIGPNMQDKLKPEVVAPGYIVSGLSSDYYKSCPTWQIVDDFDYNGKKYGWMYNFGTSMSTPVVTGIVALWLQANPKLSPDDIREVIANTSVHTVEGMEYPNYELGYGMIDAKAGIDYIKSNKPTGVSSVTVESPTPMKQDVYYNIGGRRAAKGERGVFVK